MRGRKEVQLGHDGRTVSELGAMIRAWRKRRGLSVTDLAVRAGFGESGRSYISKIEHGLIQHVGDERLDKIARALGISVVELFLKQPSVQDFLAEGSSATPTTAMTPQIDEWSIVNLISRGASRELPVDFPPSPHPAALGESPPGDAGATSASTPRIQREAGVARLEIPATLAMQVQRTIDEAIGRVETSTIAHLRQIIREQVRPIVIQLVMQEVTAALATHSVPAESVVSGSATSSRTAETSSEHNREVAVSHPAIFPKVLREVLERRGANLNTLFAVRGGEGRIDPRQLQRLKRATEGDSSVSVTLSPKELASLARALSLTSDDERRLRAALLAESVYRFLLDRVEGGSALTITEQLFDVLLSKDSAALL